MEEKISITLDDIAKISTTLVATALASLGIDTSPAHAQVMKSTIKEDLVEGYLKIISDYDSFVAKK
jgi:hypothetical protein